MKKHLLSTKQVAELVGTTRSNLTKMRQKGRITAVKEGNTFYFDPAEISRVFPNVSGGNMEETFDRKIPEKRTDGNIPNVENVENGNISSVLLEKKELEAEVKLLQIKIEHEKEKNDLLKERTERAEKIQDELLEKLEKRELFIEDMRKKGDEKPRKKFLGIF